MMKFYLVFLIIILTTSQTYARSFGVGAILGSPTGLSGKYFLGNNAAVDAAFSYSSNEVVIYGDYLKHFPGAFRARNAFISSLNPYVGIGPVIAFGDKDKNKHFIDDDEDSFGIGARIPLGVEWMANEIPLGVSL